MHTTITAAARAPSRSGIAGAVGGRERLSSCNQGVKIWDKQAANVALFRPLGGLPTANRMLANLAAVTSRPNMSYTFPENPQPPPPMKKKLRRLQSHAQR